MEGKDYVKIIRELIFESKQRFNTTSVKILIPDLIHDETAKFLTTTGHEGCTVDKDVHSTIQGVRILVAF